MQGIGKKTSLNGTVASLMAAGSAREFIQPHYLPIPTSPRNTGMSFGGIGSAYTATPAGTVPALHIIPGLHVMPETGEDLALNDFYYAEFRRRGNLKLTIRNIGGFRAHNAYYSLTTPAGKAFFKGDESLRESAAILNSLINKKKLISSNEAKLKRWHTQLSPKTLALQSGAGSYQLKNFYFLLDFYGSLISRNPSCGISLTGVDKPAPSAAFTACRTDAMAYRALYPVAETEYHSAGQHCRVVKQQFSAVVPGNEKLCALPAVFHVFHVENPGKTAVEVTLIWAQENLCGNSLQKQRPGVQDAGFFMKRTPRHLSNSLFQEITGDGRHLTGIRFGRKIPGKNSDFQGETAIGVMADRTEVDIYLTAKPQFYSNSRDAVIAEALHTGRLNPKFNMGITSGWERLSGALCVTMELKPGQKTAVALAQSFDFPFIDLPGYRVEKRYTKFFPRAPHRAEAVCRFALENWAGIRRQIFSAFEAPGLNAWQAFIGSRPALKKKLSTLMHNTLSFLAEGSVWDKDNRFLVRECADYPFFNSLDVYFYGSFAVTYLLPELDAIVIRDFARAVLSEDKTNRRYWIYSDAPHADMAHPKYEGPRAVKGAMVHDLGSAFDAKPDAYIWHNVKEWKDLAPKFVLMVWRNYRYTGNKQILRDCHAAVEAALDFLIRLTPRGAAIPPTRGCDDTFDNLSSFGVSAYCGSLWIAGLKAAEAIASTLGQTGKAAEYSQLRRRAETEFRAHLWDEESGYYHFCAVPVYPDHIHGNHLQELMKKTRNLGVHAQGRGLINALEALNKYLCQTETRPLPTGWVQSVNKLITRNFKGKIKTFRKSEKLTRLRRRTLKKLLLLSQGGKFWQPGYWESLTQDSDSIFGDQLLADTYLQLTGLPTITDIEKRRRILKRLMEISYKTANPDIGIANLVDRNGGILDSFQAQDVWIGVQYSNAAALISAGMNGECFELLKAVYTCLYEKAKIPFAAPEGFNGSVILEPQALSGALPVPLEKSRTIIALMKKEYPWILNHKGRISPDLPENFSEFKKGLKGQYFGLKGDAALKSLHTLLKSTGLQYTAGRYFRPGMIFALPRMLDCIRKQNFPGG